MMRRKTRKVAADKADHTAYDIAAEPIIYNCTITSSFLFNC